VKDIARLLNDMMDAGVITNYALFGALAQVRYTEPVATLDADVLVAVPEADRLDVLAPLYEFCRRRGLAPEGEAIRVGEWPLQFIPVFSPLASDAVEQADATDFEGVPFRVVRADFLAAMALQSGRAKDMARILALLESKSVTPEEIEVLASRHDLRSAWEKFRTRFLDE
jgi:hypothetical protein